MPEITFSELLSQKDVLKQGTYYSYHSRIASMIAPIIGDKKISEMSDKDRISRSNYRTGDY